MMFFAFELGESRESVLMLQRIYLTVTRLLDHIQRCTVNGHLRELKVAQDNLQ